MRYDGQRITDHRELIDTPLKLVGFGEAADGELILLNYTGTIHELNRAQPPDPANPPPPFPRKRVTQGFAGHLLRQGAAPAAEGPTSRRGRLARRLAGSGVQRGGVRNHRKHHAPLEHLFDDRQAR